MLFIDAIYQQVVDTLDLLAKKSTCLQQTHLLILGVNGRLLAERPVTDIDNAG